MKKIILAGGLGALLAATAALAGPGDRAARFDVNGDGTLSVAEIQQHAVERFKRLDSNGDGAITKAEMDARRAERAQRRAGKHEGGHGDVARHGHRRGDRFAKLDADGNGTVTLAEFNAKAAERAARLDANRDGTVSREEMAAARTAFKAKRQNAQ